MLVPILVIGALVSIYIGSYALNKVIPVPKEALEALDTAACSTCHNHTCSYKS